MSRGKVTHHGLWISAALLVSTTTGCGGKPQATYPVSGVVEWKSGGAATELAGATVELQVIDGVKIRVSPRGEIRPDGKFVLRTYERDDGAPAGKYKAMVMPILLADPGTAMAKSPLDQRFQSFQSTPIVLEIKPEPNEGVVVVVERAK